jgi:tetrahydromethanopterin S-methyltransferase subunit B
MNGLKKTTTLDLVQLIVVMAGFIVAGFFGFFVGPKIIDHLMLTIGMMFVMFCLGLVFGMDE